MSSTRTDSEKGKSNNFEYRQLSTASPDDGQKKCRLLPLMLVALGILVIFIMLCVCVGLLYVKTDRLQQHVEERLTAEMRLRAEIASQNVQSRMDLQVFHLETDREESSRDNLLEIRDLESNTDESLGIGAPETEVEVATEETGANVADEQEQDDDGLSDEENEPEAIHLVGSMAYKSLRKRQEVDPYIIDVWNGSMIEDNAGFNVKDGKAIQVPQKGLYLIYAQLSWRMKRGMATFIVQKSSQKAGNSPVVNLAQCVTNFPERYAVMDSCYTSVTVQLNKHDLLSMAVQQENLTLDFQKGRSFFGAVLLQEIHED